MSRIIFLIFLAGFGIVPGMSRQKGIAEFSHFLHPLKQSEFWDVPPLYKWQEEVMDEVSRPRARCAVSCNNEAGKTNIIIPLLGLSVMNAFPGSIVFSTAGAEPQIRDQLWKYLEAKLEPYESQGWTLTPSDMTILGPKIRAGDHYLRSRWTMRVPKDAKTMEGLHGSYHHGVWCPVCVIIDEAKSVEHDIFKAAWRISPDWFLVISTPPEEEAGAFFDYLPELFGKDGQKVIHGSKDGLWTYQRKVTWDECPHLHTEERLKEKQALIAKFGMDSSFIKSSLFGEVGRESDANRVFFINHLDAIRDSMNQKKEWVKGERLAALEFSGGGDEQCIGIVDGNKVVLWEQFRETNTSKVSHIFTERLKQFDVKPHNCKGDNGGMGLAIMDNMESLGYYGIIRYMNNQASINQKEYSDRITEDHFMFREKIVKYPIILPNDSILYKQIRQRKVFQDDHNRAKLEGKKFHRQRTGESPDRLDTLIMLFSDWSMPMPKTGYDPNDVYVSRIGEEVSTAPKNNGAFGSWPKFPSASSLFSKMKKF